MLNVFLITQEHHIIQVERAINNFNIDHKESLFWFFKITKSNNWVEKYIAKRAADYNYKISYSWTFSNLVRFDSRPKKLIKELKLCSKNVVVKRLFYNQYESDYSLLAFAILKPRELILMDEGTASFAVSQKRKENLNRNQFKLFIKSLFYLKRINYPKSLTYFSQYDIFLPTSDNLESYTFNKKDNSAMTLLEKEVFFLGSSMSEVDLVNENYYLAYMIKVFDHYADNNKVTYFSHRKESLSKLKKIEAIGFEIAENDIPFEFYFETLDVSAGTIASFFSPTLQTISLQFMRLPSLEIFKIDLNELKFNKKIVSEIYQAYTINPELKLISL